MPQLGRMFARTDLTGRLHEIVCPALVLYGHRDAVMVAGAQMLMQGLMNPRGICLPRVGHEPFVEDPEAAFPPIKRSLTRLRLGCAGPCPEKGRPGLRLSTIGRATPTLQLV